METPKEYTNNLKNGIITEEMLADCLYSVNKRAKNYRDQGRRSFRRPTSLDMNRYYTYKEQLLAFLEPVCIHQQYVGKETRRVFSNTPDYKYFKNKTIVYENRYYDHMIDDYIYFYDYETENDKYLYFLYYEVADKSFHTPIKNPENWNLEIIKIQDDFTTIGQNPNSLLSPQFVVKVLETLYTKACKLILKSKTLTFEERTIENNNEIIIEKKNYNITERQSAFIKELCEFYKIDIPDIKKKSKASKWIKDMLKTHNYAIDKKKHETLERYKNIFNDYQNGFTIDELTEKYNVKKPTIKKAIKLIMEQKESH